MVLKYDAFRRVKKEKRAKKSGMKQIYFPGNLEKYKSMHSFPKVLNPKKDKHDDTQ